MVAYTYLQTLSVFLLFAGIQLVAGRDDVWFLDFAQPIAREQIDPIVTPNRQASHMHRVFGGSNFRASYSFADYASSSCTTAPVQADKSAYWAPQLYFMDVDAANKTVYVPLTADVRIYYALARNKADEPVNPFPEGLQILTGNPNNKSPDPNLGYTRYVCQGTSGIVGADNFNFDRPCPNGMKSTIRFPNCWNGVDLYKSDGSHVAFSGVGENIGRPCPWTHPYRFPGIQMEMTWKTSKWSPDKALAGRLIYSDGDTTGYGHHADFVNGWDTSVLAAALVHPDCVGGHFNSTMLMSFCPPLGATWSDAAAASCSPKFGILQEPTGNDDYVPIPALPGCNLPWGATGPKPTCSPAVAKLDVTALQGPVGSLVAPASQQSPYVRPELPIWNYLGCSGTPGAYFVDQVDYYDPNLTPARCQASCMANGLVYAGVGPLPSFACFCGSALSNVTTFTDGCTSSCPGGNGTCGGPSRLSVYYSGPGTPSTRSDPSQLGCYGNPYVVSTGLVGIADYTFTSNQMTKEVCIAACANRGAGWGFTTGSSCSCGTQPYNRGAGAYRPDDFCTTPCNGNSSQICGGRGLLSVYNITAAGVQATNTSASKLPGWQGCFSDSPTGAPALNFTWQDNSMTASVCQNSCSEMGYALAAVQAGMRCRCGQVWAGGSILPASQCTTPCTGNGNVTCGGGANLERFDTSYATDTVASVAAEKPPGYLGCYYTPNTADGVSEYSFSSASLTVESCASGCEQLGYRYAAVQGGNRCKCGNTLGVPPQRPHTFCGLPCRGNSSETCGAAFFSEAYDSEQWEQQTQSQGTGFVGCFVDSSANGGGAPYSFQTSNATYRFCRSACAEIKYPLAILGQGNRCSCATTWTGGQQLPASQCSTPCAGNSTQTCGAATAASVFNTTGAVPPPVVPEVGYLGCFSDASKARALQNGFAYGSSDMTPSICQATCRVRGFSLAAVMQGNQCTCGNANSSPMQVPTVVCATRCYGDNSRICGGSGVASLYNTTLDSSTGTQDSMGCFSDVNTLDRWLYSSTYMTNPICAAACAKAGYAFSGTWNGNTCRCGQNSPLTVAADSACSSNCTGDASSACGSGSRITVAKASSSSAVLGDPYTMGGIPGGLGCYLDAATFKPLNALTYGSAKMTPTQCISNCKMMGYSFAGLEAQKSCYCDNAVNVTLTGYRVRDTDCNAACTGDATQTCGNSGRMSIYDVAISEVPAASAPSTSEGYQGCYAAGTLLTSSASYSYKGTISASLCRRTCRVKGFSAAAVSNANQCVCTSDSSTYGPLQPLAACAMPCNGNSSEICGSSNLFSLYDTKGSGAFAPATGYPSNYVGCFLDTDMIAKSVTRITSTSLTSESCARICSAKGATIYGTWQGSTCWCGTAMPATQVLESQCPTACSGSSSEICGGTGRLSVYNPALAGAPSPPAIASTSSLSSSLASATPTNATVSSAASAATNTTLRSTSVPPTTSLTTSAVTLASGTASSTSANGTRVASTIAPSTAATATATSSRATTATGTATIATTATGTATTATATATSTPIQAVVTGWKYQYCLQDSQTRSMNYTHATSSTLTAAKCAAICDDFAYFGVEGGNMCFCSNLLNSNVTLSASSCGQSCLGDSKSLCGGTNAIALYRNTLLVASSSGVMSTATGTSTQRPVSSGTSTGTRPASSSAPSSASSSTVPGKEFLVSTESCSGVGATQTTTKTVYVTVAQAGSASASSTATHSAVNGTRAGKRHNPGGFAVVRRRARAAGVSQRGLDRFVI